MIWALSMFAPLTSSGKQQLAFPPSCLASQASSRPEQHATKSKPRCRKASPHRARHVVKRCRDYRIVILSRITSGWRSAICNSRNAAPLGSLSPCSQDFTDAELTLRASANTGCDNFINFLSRAICAPRYFGAGSAFARRAVTVRTVAPVFSPSLKAIASPSASMMADPIEIRVDVRPLFPTFGVFFMMFIASQWNSPSSRSPARHHRKAGLSPLGQRSRASRNGHRLARPPY